MSDKQPLVDLLIHDLMEPLSIASTSISNLLNKTERYGPLTDRQRGALKRVLRNTRKAQTLLFEMVEVSRSKEGLFRRERFYVAGIVRESLATVMEFLDPEASEGLQCAANHLEFLAILRNKGVFLHIMGRYRDAPFCHDQQKIQQILRNLLSNALKHRRSRVDVRVHGERDLIFSVEDDGPGIPSTRRDAIFDRFVRFGGETPPEIPGLGLGLTGVQNLLDAMGGDIKVESGQGFGSRFTVRIPPLSSHSKTDTAVKKSGLDRKTILAVDDEPDVLALLEEEVHDAYPDCVLDKATHYEGAVQLLAGWTYDLVILDIMGVQGFELLDLAVHRGFPVVMLTAHALSPEALKRSIELGARAYLPKEKLGEVVPFLEEVLTHQNLPGWKRLFDKLGGFFTARFGADWQKTEEAFWREFHRKLDAEEGVILR